jgi:hypothetical protein
MLSGRQHTECCVCCALAATAHASASLDGSFQRVASTAHSNSLQPDFAYEPVLIFVRKSEAAFAFRLFSERERPDPQLSRSCAYRYILISIYVSLLALLVKKNQYSRCAREDTLRSCLSMLLARQRRRPYTLLCLCDIWYITLIYHIYIYVKYINMIHIYNQSILYTYIYCIIY